MVLVHPDIDSYALLVSSHQQLEAIAIFANIGRRPVKLVVVYLSSLCSLLAADLSESFGGGKQTRLSGRRSKR